jgi:hypothetical protein
MAAAKRHAAKRRKAKARCAHHMTVLIVRGVKARWCKGCGAVHDGQRWHHPRPVSVGLGVGIPFGS